MKVAAIFQRYYSGGGSFDQQLLNSNPEFWIRADRVVDGVVTDLAGNYSATVINSPVVIEDSINGQPAINLVASEQNGIHIGAVSNFTQFVTRVEVIYHAVYYEI